MLATGEELWKVPRQYDWPQESDQAYTTPQVVKIDGKDQSSCGAPIISRATTSPRAS